jgi:hypothetical protein
MHAPMNVLDSIPSNVLDSIPSNVSIVIIAVGEGKYALHYRPSEGNWLIHPKESQFYDTLMNMIFLQTVLDLPDEETYIKIDNDVIDELQKSFTEGER